VSGPPDLPAGIQWDRGRYRIRVWVGGKEYPRRLPKGTDLETAVRERNHLLADAERDQLPKAPSGTFAADAQAYLKAVKAMPSYDDRARDIALWVREFGTQPRQAITPLRIRQVRDRWLTVGPVHVQKWKRDKLTGRKKRTWVPKKRPCAAGTVNLRLRALENFFTITAPDEPNPVRKVTEAEETPKPPRALPVTLVRLIFALMRPSAAKARLLALAWAGLPYATLARMDATMVDLDAAEYWRPGRKKGQGTKGQRVPLTPDGVEAFRAVIEWKAWSQPDRSRCRRTFALARNKAQRALAEADVVVDLSSVTPYALRHTFGTEVYAGTGDFKATAGLLGVSHVTAGRYAEAAVNPRLKAAADRLAEQWHPAAPAKAPAQPPAHEQKS
jgi:integrase